MTVPAIIVIAGVTVLVASVFLFRVVSRYHPMACPAWATVVLENPYMKAVAGSAVLLDRARVEPGLEVLDVGCGPGRLTLPAAERVGRMGRVVALDLQPAMIRKLKERMTAKGLTNIRTVVGGAGEGHIAHKAFDRVLLVGVLGEIVDQSAALGEIREALKPGALVSITEVLPDPHYQSRRRVRRLAEAAGLELVGTYGHWYAFTMNFVSRRP